MAQHSKTDMERKHFMKSKIISRINMIISALIAMLGFSSCIPKCEYGVPHTEFRASGTITDENKKPIENIQVDIRHEGKSLLWQGGSYTGKNGKYSVQSGWNFSAPFDSLDIVATDTAGVYATDSVRVSTETNKKGDGHWLQGVAEVTADIHMKTITEHIE